MNRGIHRLFAFGLVLLALLIIGAAGAAPKGGLTVDLKVAQSEFRSSQNVLVTVTLSNPSKQSARILKWLTPADGVDESLFTVTRDGQPVPYVGAVTKRPAATDGDYLVLGPGASVSSVVDLGDFYDLTGTGRYEISYNVSAYDLFGKSSPVSKPKDALTSDAITLKVAGRAAKGKPQPPPPPPPNPDGNTFNACSTAQQSALNSARTKAKQYAVDAESYLSTGAHGPRYTTWFGGFTSGRYGTVTSHFTAISLAMRTAAVTFDCSSRRKVYAYVYPDEPYKIYLGSVYWSAPAAGTDSQAGTLIHEMSHFYVVASTDDVVYGQAGAKSLAISNPDAAITNADSHEYFAENTPTQN